MKRENGRGRLTVGYGPMGGGKTEWLIARAKPTSLVILPQTDSRSNGVLRSHSHKEYTRHVYVVPANKPEMAFSFLDDESIRYTEVFIDETNFFDGSLESMVKALLRQGFDVTATGLLLDSDLHDFGPTRKLAAMADETKKFLARCDWSNGSICEKPAIFNYFKGEKPGQVVVGAFDMYGASCEDHYNHFREQYGLPVVAKNKVTTRITDFRSELHEQLGENYSTLKHARVVLMCGLPGSGKSFWARKIAQEIGARYVSSDVVRLSKVYRDQEKYLSSTDSYLQTRELTYQLIHQKALDAVSRGEKVVLDATYLGPQQDRIIAALAGEGVLNNTVACVVKTDEKVILARVRRKRRLKNGERYEDGWKIAYDWFDGQLRAGKVAYFDGNGQGLKVVELWNN